MHSNNEEPNDHEEVSENNLNDTGSNLIQTHDAPTDHKTNALSSQELIELEKHEAVISKGKKIFLEVGKALLAIHDQRLYRAQYPSFEEYCDKKWNLGPSHAYRLMESTITYDQISPIGETANQRPINESQLRPLTGLPPDTKRAAYAAAVKDAGVKPVTAKHVAKAAAQFKKSDPPKMKVEVNAKNENAPLIEPQKTESYKGTPADDRAIECMDEALTVLRAIKSGTLSNTKKRDLSIIANQLVEQIKKL